MVGDAAIESGSIRKLKWVLDRDPYSWLPVRATSTAARLGHTAMLEYLVTEKKCDWQHQVDGIVAQTTLTFAMTSDHLTTEETKRVLKSCIDLGAPLTVADVAGAASHGQSAYNFALLQWLLEHDQCPCPLGPAVLSSASAYPPVTFTRKQALERGFSADLIEKLSGSTSYTTKLIFPLMTVKWLRAQGLPWSSGVMNASAKYGNIELLEYAHAQGCEFTANTIDVAAYHGQLEAIQWLHSRGCPIGPKATVKAAAQGRQAALTWLILHPTCLHPTSYILHPTSYRQRSLG